MTYREIVYSAGNVLLSHELGKLVNVARMWSDMQWYTHDKQEIKAHAEVCADEPAIRLYPSLQECAEAGRCVLREFGLFLLKQAGDDARNIWRNKLCLPEKGQIESFNRKINDTETMGRASGFLDVIDSYLAACDRYVALNLANALQINNIPFSDAQGVNIYQWGPTLEYANRRRYHSLVPLTSVYASREQNDNFGEAFADLLIENLGSVREKSVAEQMREIIKHVVVMAP